jgi:hypothetical protein
MSNLTDTLLQNVSDENNKGREEGTEEGETGKRDGVNLLTID